MTEPRSHPDHPDPHPVEHPEIVPGRPHGEHAGDGDGPPPTPEGAASGGEEARSEAVAEPAKVMRIGAMTKQLLDELRNTELDAASRERLRTIHATAVSELSDVLSDDLRSELEAFAFPFDDDAPSEGELRVAQAQLVGWLEGLFQGIQLTLFSQQVAARQQLESMRAKAQLTPGSEARPGTYL